jgi:hypothetical protein
MDDQALTPEFIGRGLIWAKEAYSLCSASIIYNSYFQYRGSVPQPP